MWTMHLMLCVHSCKVVWAAQVRHVQHVSVYAEGAGPVQECVVVHVF